MSKRKRARKNPAGKKPRRTRVFRMIAVDRPGYLGTQEDFKTKAEAIAAAERFMATHAPHSIPAWASSGAAYVMVEDRRPNGDHYTVARWIVDYSDWKLDYVRQNPAKLERCVKSVKKSGKAANPWAVCTAMLRKSKTRRNPVNHDAARELELYVENDGDLYRQMQKPIENNLLRKMKAKKYSSALALKAWQHLMDAGAKKYSKEFGGTWHVSFPVSERREAARRFRDHFEVEVKAAGGPSKYR